MTYGRVAIVLLFAGCTSSNAPADAPKPPVDAKVYMDSKVYMDAKVFMDSSAMVCTGKLYDACNPAASNCMAGTMCKTFAGSGFSVCTQTCTTTCPAQGAAAVTCNTMGICKPSAPNSDCVSP
jgi:hypothetical protein